VETKSLSCKEQLAKYLPKPNKIYNYHFSTETTNLKKEKKVWKKIERKVEIIYLGKKDGFRLYQILTTKIILTSNQAYPNKALLRKIGYIFDYIEVGVSDKGFIKKVFNIDDLKSRTKEIRSHLEKDHEGEAFSQFFNGINRLFDDEKKIIQFLQSYKMFGLCFTGLNQSFQTLTLNTNDRKKVLDDFDYVEIEEEVTGTKNDHIYTFIVSKKNKEGTIKKYRGIYKTEYNELINGFIEIENEEINIKYSTSWVG
jgi:hypothetical protein